MAIEEVIEVNAGEAIAQLDAFAAAAEEAAAKYEAAMERVKGGMSGGASSASADKMAAAMDAAAEKISAAAAKVEESLGKIGAAGEAAAAGLGPAAGAADTAAAANDRLAGSAGGAADAEKAIGESAAAAGAGLDEAAAGADAAATATARVGKAGAEGAAGLDATAASAGKARDSLGRFTAAGDEAAASSARVGKASAASAETGAAGFMKFAKVVAISGGIAAAYGIDKAMKLNAEVTRLYTAAGLKGVSPAAVTAADLAIGTQTGYSGQAIAQAEYHPVSAGLDWKTTQGLTTQSANLANIHGANLEDTTYAMSSVMKAYNMGAKEVTPTAALLNSIVGQGDMRFQDFNESVKNFAPTGASMGISLQSMGAGLAYLTDRGNTAEVASTRLTMGLSMATAGSKAANVYMKDLGLTTGTLDLKNKSLQATMVAGGLTTNKFASDLKKSDGLYVALTDMQGAFHKAGLSGAQADQVMAKIFGGGRSDKAIVSLMQNLGGVKQKYDQIGAGVKNYGADVATEQATAAQKWANFKAGMGNLATGFGGSLLPYFTSLAGEADKFLGFLQGSKGASTALVGTVGGLAALFTGKKLVSGVESAFSTGETALRGVGKVAQVLNIPGLDKLANIGKGGTAGAAAASGSLDRVAGAGNAAAAALDRVAGAGGAAAAGEDAAGAAGGKAAAGETAAGGGGVLAKGGSALGAGIMAAAGSWLIGHAVGAFLPKATAQQSQQYKAAIPGLLQAPANFVFGSKAASLYSDLPKMGGPVAGSNWENWYHNVLGGSGGQQHGPMADIPGRQPVDPTRQAGAIPEAWDNLFSGVRSLFTSHAAPAAQNLASPAFWKAGGPAAAPVMPAGPAAKSPPVGAGFTDMLAGAMKATKPARIPAPDLSALTAAKGKVAADMAGITSVLASAMKKPVKLPPPDLSALSAAKGKATADVSSITQAIDSAMRKPAKMAAPDLGALDAGKAKAMTAAQGIQQAAQAPLQKPVKAAPPDISAFSAARGPAAADGAQISAGLASGILANEGAVVAAASAVAAAAAAAMSHALAVKSPSKVTEKIGAETSAGLAKGITSGTGKVKASALTLSATTITSLTQGLQGGTSAINAALTAVTGKGSRPQDITTITGTISTLQGDLSRALAGKQISKPEDSALTKMLRADNTKLQALSAQRTMLETEITDSSQIAQQAISNASVMNSLTATPIDPSQAVSSIAIIQGMQVQANQAAAFARQIGQLQKSGLNATSLNQITQSGATSGLPITQSLISGGPKAIAQINALEKQIQGSAARLGDAGGPAMYQAGVQAAQGLAAGLKSQLSSVDAAITKMADSITAAIKKALKIRSPSLVFAEIGGYLPQGLAQGVDAESAVAESAVARMAARTAGAYGRQAAGHPAGMPGGYGGGSGGGSGGGNVTTVIVNVTLDGKTIASNVTSHVLTTALNNVSGGLQLRGRNV